MKKELTCFKCVKSNFKILFDYKNRPKSEKKYKIIGKYRRQFYQCKKCNHISAKHFFKFKDIYLGDYFDNTYKNLDNLSYRFNTITNLPIKKSDNKNRANRIYKFLNKKKINLLDVGSGTGVFLYEKKKKGINVEGIDLEKRYALFLKTKKIKAHTCKLKNLKTKKKYDVITINKVLEHLENPQDMLKQSIKFLKKDGLIYLEVPHCSAIIKGKLTNELCIEHLDIYSSQSLISMAKSSGLTPLKVSKIIEPSNKYTLYGFFKKD